MKPGTVIVLNGTSSSGKTSIIRALQESLDEPFLEAGIDKFIWMMPRRYLERPLWDDVLGLAHTAGTAGQQLVRTMHTAVAAISRSGSHVIADHVLVDPRWLPACAAAFADLPAYFIGVRCPLEVLEARETMRRDRTLGQAKAQFHLVHAHAVYDLEVDTALLTPQQCAAQIIARLADPPSAFKRLTAV